MNIEIYPRRVFTTLLCLIFVLLFLNVIGVIARYYFDQGSMYGLISLFNFDTEKNIPTFYSSLALIFASALLLIIASTHKNNGSAYLSWLGLAIVFLFLSIDEIAQIHERIGMRVRESLNVSGLLYFAWVIPYGTGLIVFVIAYLKFLMSLPKNIMILFVVSGVTFVTGAIGIESFAARHVELHGKDNLIHSFYYTGEEFLEMLGIVIFIYTLLTYIVSLFGSLTITVNEPK